MILIKKYWQEIFVVFMLILLMYANKYVGISYLSLEALFMITLGMAFFFRFKRSNFKISYRLYLANRVVGILQPALTLALALTYYKVSVTQHWYVYVLLSLDILITVFSIGVFSKYFTEVSVRVAEIDDIDDLVEIEKSAFDDKQEASRDTIKKRLKTHPQTCFIAIHPEHGAVGSLYVRTINSETLDNALFEAPDTYGHSLICNDGDFSMKDDHNAFYIVGLQGKRGTGVAASKYLEAFCAKRMIEMGIGKLYAGLRVPEYHRYDSISIQEFLDKKKSKFVNHHLKLSNIPLVVKTVVAKGIENYFPDEQSLDCAALIATKLNYCSLPNWLRKPLSSLVYAAYIL